MGTWLFYSGLFLPFVLLFGDSAFCTLASCLRASSSFRRAVEESRLGSTFDFPPFFGRFVFFGAFASSFSLPLAANAAADAAAAAAVRAAPIAEAAAACAIARGGDPRGEADEAEEEEEEEGPVDLTNA